MRIAIDASNIREGGGVTHLVEFLRVANPSAYGLTKIFVWACSATLAQIEDRPWLEKRTDAVLERGFIKRAIWQRVQLGKLATKAGTDLLFVPGGSIIATFHPAVTMCRNMLPFEFREMRRFGFSKQFFKMLILRFTQSISFRKADGTIFLTKYARDRLLTITGPLKGSYCIIPHGINERFRQLPRPQRSIEQATDSDPIRIVYVSIVDVYKHQWSVAEAVALLRKEGFPVSLDLYGPSTPKAMRRLVGTLNLVDPKSTYIRYQGAIDHNQIDQCYRTADVCVYASSCENLPNILIEAMAAALPIAASYMGPMPEVLGDAGVYFNPEDPFSIASALRKLLLNSELRTQKAAAAAVAASKYSWTLCADKTLAFLVEASRHS